MRAACPFAAVLVASVLLAVRCHLPWDPFPNSSGSFSGPDSQDSIKVLLSLLEKHGSDFTKEMLEKLPFLQTLPPEVLEQSVMAHLPVLLQQLKGGGNGGGGKEGGEGGVKGGEGLGMDPVTLMNIAQGLSHGLNPWADRLNEMAPIIEALLKAQGVGLAVEKKVGIRNERFCHLLDNVCYAETLFHY